DHAIMLTNLTAETDYFFEVTSRGRLGNATTDANGGLLYRYRTNPLGDVLVVIGGPSFPPEREASYEAGLSANGWTHSFWRIADQGLPGLAVLQARRAVLWQVGLEQYPPFDAAERDLVKRYLDGGGRLIVASHDAAWALSDSNSSFASPGSAAWVQGVLKARFVCDPSSIARANGIPSDPISGAYTGGVLYTPHRTDGADDELAAISAGGPTTTIPTWPSPRRTGASSRGRPSRSPGRHRPTAPASGSRTSSSRRARTRDSRGVRSRRSQDPRGRTRGTWVRCRTESRTGFGS